MSKWLTIFVTAVLLSSCAKDRIEFVPDPGQQLDSVWVSTINDDNKISELIKSFSLPALINDTTTLSNDTTFIHREKFDIIIPPGALKSSTTANLYGRINYSFFLLQKKGDFIKLQQSTINADKNALYTGGNFFLRFSKDNEALTIVPGKIVIIRFNDPQPTKDMKVFYGTENLNPTTPVNICNGWAAANSVAYVKPVQRIFNSISSYGYEVGTDKLSWINTGALYPYSTSSINLSVYVPDLFSNANTEAYLVLKDQRCVIKLSGEAGTRKFSAPNIPSGKSAIVVTVSKVSEDYFLGSTEIITSDKPVEVKPAHSSLDHILDFLNSL